MKKWNKHQVRKVDLWNAGRVDWKTRKECWQEKKGTGLIGVENENLVSLK